VPVAHNGPADALACNPIDFVTVAGTVKVVQDLINGLNSSLIDFWMRR